MSEDIFLVVWQTANYLSFLESKASQDIEMSHVLIAGRAFKLHRSKKYVSPRRLYGGEKNPIKLKNKTGK